RALFRSVIGADVPHVVDVIRHDIHVVPVVGVDAVPAGVTHLETLDAHVAAVDLDTDGRAAAPSVDDRLPAVRGPEHQPRTRRAEIGRAHDVGAPRIDAVV